jgi:hypothetical protein
VMGKLWHDTAVLSADAWCLELMDRHEPCVLEGARAHRASVTLGDSSIDGWLALLSGPRVGLLGTAGRLAAHRDLL